MIDIEVKHPTLQFTKEEVVEILAQFNRTLDNVQVDIDSIKIWFGTQPHLTQVPEDRLILTFLIRNKFSIEKTKTKLDYYYTIRGMIPEVFANRFPSSQDIIALRNSNLCFTLSRLVNLNRVIFFIIEDVPKTYEGCLGAAKIFMDGEGMVYRDLHSSVEFVCDYSRSNFTFWSSITPMIIKYFMTYAEKVFSNRTKAIRVVGIPSIAKNLIDSVMTIVPKKLRERASFHSKRDEIAKYYPKELLPFEYGGTGKSFREMAAKFDDMIDHCEEYFQSIQNFRVIEKLRPSPLDNDEMLGFHGNFRKLEVD